MIETVDLFYPGLNFFQRTAYDPAYAGLMRIFGRLPDVQGYIWWQVIILVGVLLCLGIDARSACCQGLSFTRLLRHHFGNVARITALLFFLPLVIFNPFLFNLTWFVVMLVASGRFMRSRPYSAIVLLLVSFFWSLTAGNLGFLGVVISWIVSYYLNINDSNARIDTGLDAELITGVNAVEREQSVSGVDYPQYLFAIVLGLQLVLVYYTSSVLFCYPMPVYPGDAVLAPLSPLSHLTTSIVGQAFFPNTTVYSGQGGYLEFNVVILALCGIWLFCPLLFSPCITRVFRKSAETSTGWSSDTKLFLGILAIWGLSLAEIFIWRSGMFVPLLREAIPGVALLPTTAAILPLLILSYLFIKFSGDVRSIPSSSASESRQIIVSRCHGVVLIVTLPSLLALSCYLAFGGAEGGDVGGLEVAGRFVQVTESSLETSPSSFVIGTEGRWVTSESGRANRVLEDQTPLLIEFSDVDASVNSLAARLAVDGDAKTRWTTGRPQQEGDSFTFTLGKIHNVRSLWLDIAKTPADFPRGLLVEISDSTEGDFVTVSRHNEWFGRVRWTADGYPYFGAQSEVVVHFPQSYRVRRVRLTLLRGNERFDWSIGEVRLY